jgi:hypothetical protein
MSFWNRDDVCNLGDRLWLWAIRDAGFVKLAGHDRAGYTSGRFDTAVGNSRSRTILGYGREIRIAW